MIRHLLDDTRATFDFTLGESAPERRENIERFRDEVAAHFI